MPGKNDTQRSLTDIETALAKEFDYTKNTVVFNVRGESWLFPLTHEADMLVVGRDRKLTEVEIKRSWADFCADFKKKHLHDSTDPVRIERFIYAVPQATLDKVIKKLQAERVVPSAVITYDEDLDLKWYKVLFSLHPENDKALMSSCTQVWPWNNSLKRSDVALMLLRENIIKLDFNADEGYPAFLFDRGARPLFTEQFMELQRLGCMRQVSLREKISEYEKTGYKDLIIQRYENRIAEQQVIIQEYRSIFKKETGYSLDEKELLYG